MHGKHAEKVSLNRYPSILFGPTKGMAANQGLYNGFLSAGLVWSYFINDGTWSSNVRLFFLSCVFVAGLYGALTASRKIFFFQALPAFFGRCCHAAVYINKRLAWKISCPSQAFVFILFTRCNNFVEFFEQNKWIFS